MSPEKTSIIDRSGYRLNVGIVLMNPKGEVLWGRRVGKSTWQFPQGGVQQNERLLKTVFRELYEEIGVPSTLVDVLAVTHSWLTYRIPRHLQRNNSVTCIGQKQKWFLLKFMGKDTDINLNINASPEFDAWKWVSYWYPINEIVAFKKKVYRKALGELATQYVANKYVDRKLFTDAIDLW